MKIKVIKKHTSLPLGDAEVSEARGKYLLRMGVATGDAGSKPAPKKQAVKPAKKDK